MAKRASRAKPRKRHEQLELLNKGGTGKARRKAKRRRRAKAGEEAPRKRGRPAKNGRAGVRHAAREVFKASEPVHVVLRVEKSVGKLRRMDIYGAVRGATLVVASREEFRIVHISIQGTHLHMLVEATGRAALSRGMQAFTISAAKRMNAVLTRVNPETQVMERRKGKVFSDRYHAEVISNRRQARHALAYVLNNWRKHSEDTRTSALVDRFSSGISFRGWAAYADPKFRFTVPAGYEPMVVWEPRTWLLSVGWMIYGRIDFFEVPSAPKRTGKAKASAGVARVRRGLSRTAERSAGSRRAEHQE